MFSLISIYLIIYCLLLWPVTKSDVILVSVFELEENIYLDNDKYVSTDIKEKTQNSSNIIYDRLDIENYDEATEVVDIDNHENENSKEINTVYRHKSRKADYLDSDDNDNKIVGGTSVDISLYPYHMAYGNNCGGAIIGHKWALTAAHCGKKPYVRVGSKYLNQGKKIAVKRNYIHPRWTAASNDHPFDYDFQILELKEYLTFNDNIQPIKVAHIEDMVVGKIVTVTGWGNTKENGPFSDVLRAVRVPIVSKEKCQQVPFPYFRGHLTPRMFCAGYSEGLKDACQGDSGGPAVAGDRLLGTVSFGYGCATPGSYGVYSKVAKVRPWIKQITRLTLD